LLKVKRTILCSSHTCLYSVKLSTTRARMSLLSAVVLTLMSISCLHQGPSTVDAVLLIPGWVRHGHPLTQHGCLKLSASWQRYH